MNGTFVTDRPAHTNVAHWVADTLRGSFSTHCRTYDELDWRFQLRWEHGRVQDCSLYGRLLGESRIDGLLFCTYGSDSGDGYSKAIYLLQERERL